MTYKKSKNIAPYHIQEESNIQQIPLDRIKVLNPRSRDKKKFAQIVESISTLGLKRPITVAEAEKNGQVQHYEIVCGQGRYEAFQMLGEKEIPCIVIKANKVDRFLMGLVENIARRKHTNKDLLESVRILQDRGFSIAQIAKKTALDPAYISGIIDLLRRGEDMLISAVEKGWLSIGLAVKIAQSGDAEVQEAMVKAYNSGLLNGQELIRVRGLINRRIMKMSGAIRGNKREGKPPITAQKLLKTYQAEVQRQKIMIKKAEINEQKLLFITSALRKVLQNEHFQTLLRAEGIEDMPKQLALKIQGA